MGLESLLELLVKADEHHDESKPAVSHDLKALASSTSGTSLREAIVGMLTSKEVVSALLPLVLGLLTRERKPAESVHNPPTIIPIDQKAPPTAPSAPASPAGVTPDFIELTLSGPGVKGPGRHGEPQIDHVLEADGTIRLVGGTTSLDDGSTIVLDAGIQAKGRGLRIDLDPARTPPGETNHPELLGRQIYIAEDAATGELLGRIGGPGVISDDEKAMGHFDNGVSFVPNRYRETGGMAVAVRLKRKGGPVRIFARIADAESNAFVTPEVR